MSYDATTKAPDGYARVAWATYTSLRGVGRLSKVHLMADTDGTRTGRLLCGQRRPKRSRPYYAKHDSDFRDHEKDAGLCSRCWQKVGA